MKEVLRLCLLAFFLVLLLGYLMPEWEEDDYPRIEDFLAVQIKSKTKISFSFSGISGGIEKAEFMVASIIGNNNLIVYSNPKKIFTIKPEFRKNIVNIDGDITKGTFETMIPIPGNERFGSNDTIIIIKYGFLVIDDLNRKSNLAETVLIAKKNRREW